MTIANAQQHAQMTFSVIAPKNLQWIVNGPINEEVTFKLKGTGEVEVIFVGCGHCQDEDGTRCVGPRQCIQQMIDSCSSVFGEKPKSKQNMQSPLKKNDHPKLNDSDQAAQFPFAVGQTV